MVMQTSVLTARLDSQDGLRITSEYLSGVLHLRLVCLCVTFNSHGDAA